MWYADVGRKAKKEIVVYLFGATDSFITGVSLPALLDLSKPVPAGMR